MCGSSMAIHSFNIILYYVLEMFHLGMSLFVVLLFVLLTPGVLLTLPSTKSSLLTVAVVHGVVFALVLHLTQAPLLNYMTSHRQ